MLLQKIDLADVDMTCNDFDEVSSDFNLQNLDLYDFYVMEDIDFCDAIVAVHRASGQVIACQSHELDIAECQNEIDCFFTV